MSETSERIKREWMTTHEGSGFEDLYEEEFDKMLNENDQPRISPAEAYYLELLREVWGGVSARSRKKIRRADSLIYIALSGLAEDWRRFR